MKAKNSLIIAILASSALASAYAKFAGDNSAMERAAKAREKAGFLRALLSEIDR